MLRSVTGLGGEEGDQREARCDLSFLKAALEGYLCEYTLSEYERRSVFYALLLISYELGVRFFTDYLVGSRYFAIQYPEQNLHRAVVQLKLADNVQKKKTEIDEIV